MTRALTLFAILALAACREGPAEFQLMVPPTVGESGGRLTHSEKDDRSPAWNGSESLLYAAVSYVPFPATKGFLLTIPREGGTVRPLIEAVQFGASTQPWLTAPALSPSGNRLAFIEITDSVARLPGAFCEPGSDARLSEPVLSAGALRVRSLSGAGQDDATLPITFEGVTVDSTQHPFGLDFVTIEISHPFQRQFQGYRMPLFRPTWSPDGTRIAFSDGMNIRVWTVGQATSAVIPGTQDGIFPAWSPDGSRIGFTRLTRAGSRTFTCLVLSPSGFVAAQYQRTVFGGIDRSGTLVTINVNGSQAVELGEGYAPAWTPDGTALIATRSGSLWRIPITGAAAVVPATEDAYEPAVSPDGNWLAFTREQPEPQINNNDIWVLRLR
jgi:hypothetical protein